MKGKAKQEYLNTSESILFGQLKEAIRLLGYTVNYHVPISEVIQENEIDLTEPRDRQAYGKAHFDFVVFRNTEGETERVFAVEFDGRCHEKPEKKRSDPRKNKWCKEARLPLLRVSDFDVTDEDRYLLLKYLIERYIAFNGEIRGIVKEIKDRYGADEIDPRDADGLIPRDMDPYRVFDIRHPFPGINELIDKIAGELLIHVDYNPPTNTILYRRKTNGGYAWLPVELASEFNDIEMGPLGNTVCIINGGRYLGVPKGTKTTFSCWWHIIKDSGVGSHGYRLSSDGGPISVNGAYELIKEGRVSITLGVYLSIDPGFEPTADNVREFSEKGLAVPALYAGLPGSEYLFIMNRFTCYLALKAAYEWLSANENVWKGSG